jgi:hypothetical protein
MSFTTRSSTRTAVIRAVVSLPPITLTNPEGDTAMWSSRVTDDESVGWSPFDMSGRKPL